MLALRQGVSHTVKQWRRIPASVSFRGSSMSATSATIDVPFPSTTPLQVPHPDGPDKPLSPKLEQLVATISALTLYEVAELSKALKKRLNIPDAPAIPAGMVFGAPQQQVEEEEAAPKVIKTSFNLKLLKYDEKQKVPLIKEIKNVMEGMNLVQAKKFVESAPAIVMENISKEEAERLKEVLDKVGAVCEIE